MKLEVKKDRKEINNIIKNCLPLMKKNNAMTQECADAIIVYFINKLEIINNAQQDIAKQKSDDLNVKSTAQLNNRKVKNTRNKWGRTYEN